MQVVKAAVFFDKIFNLVFLLIFSVIRWNFGIFFVLFNGGVLLGELRLSGNHTVTEYEMSDKPYS